MSLQLNMQFVLMLRILIGVICGGVIGFERKNRSKEAGIRTHIIVALASTLIMIISKYAFNDLIGNDFFKLDPSRIAASIVSGVGFLGAGIIFVRKETVSGLTTAAGIWATSGVGMAIGAGEYFIGIFSAFLIVMTQIILHKDFHWLNGPINEQIYIELLDDDNAIAYLQKELSKLNIKVISIKADKIENSKIEVTLLVKLPKGFKEYELMDVLKGNKYVKSIIF